MKHDWEVEGPSAWWPQHEADDLYRLVLDSIQEFGLFALDAGGLVETWNPGAERITGYSSVEIIGSHVSVLFPTEDMRAAMPTQQLWTAALDGRVESQCWLVRKTGYQFLARIIITPMNDESGIALGFAAIIHDLTKDFGRL